MSCARRRRLPIRLLLTAALAASGGGAAADVYLDTAKIETTIRAPLRGLVGLLSLQPHPVGRRVLTINGRRLFAELSHTALPPRRLIERIERRYAEAGPEDLAGAQPFFLANDDWAVVGHLSLGGRGSRASSAIELPYLLLAIRDRQRRSTAVWASQPEPGFDLTALFDTDANGDVAGVEPDDLERPADTRRVFSLIENSAVGESHILGFEGPGPVAVYAEHYAAELRDAGYRNLRFSGADGDRPPLLIASNDDGRQVSVFIEPPSTVQDAVLILLQINMEPGKRIRD